MDKHMLGPFAGLIICVSGGAMKLKQEQQALIVEKGGTRSPELTQYHVTHLVINRQPGPHQMSEKER